MENFIFCAVMKEKIAMDHRITDAVCFITGFNYVNYCKHQQPTSTISGGINCSDIERKLNIFSSKIGRTWHPNVLRNS